MSGAPDMTLASVTIQPKVRRRRDGYGDISGAIAPNDETEDQ